MPRWLDHRLITILWAAGGIGAFVLFRTLPLAH